MTKSVFNSMLAIVVTGVISLGAFAQNSNRPYPQGPDPILTPGQLCRNPDARRYKEKIAYCRRDVEPREKENIIDTYDKSRGYQISRLPRNEFKIDHYIPLCAGGSNERENLWPQHESIYTVTDPLEALICEKMAAGRLLQAEAVFLIKQAKGNIYEVPRIMAYVKRR